MDGFCGNPIDNRRTAASRCATLLIQSRANMYLMRIGEPGAERPVVRITEEAYVDMSDVTGDFDEEFFGRDQIGPLRAVVQQRIEGGRVSYFEGERIAAPIARPHQVLCIGLNYRDHAIETGQPIPTE